MGFFSELKEDLSQAVNELMPEEAEQTQPEMEAEIQTETVTVPAEDDAADGDDLAAMLEKLDLESMQMEETEPEETAEVPQETVEETTDADSEASLEELFAKELHLEMESQETKAAETSEKKNTIDERVAKTMEEQSYSDNEMATDEKSVITEGMTINGDISSKGSMDVLGSIVGNIDIKGKLDVSGSVQGNSKAAEIFADSAKIVGEVNSMGSVKIGQSSVIIGNISATSAVIAGAIKGDIDVRGPVILDTSAIVMGNIKSKSVQINNGAVVEGLCSQCYADVNPSAFFDEFKKTAKA